MKFIHVTKDTIHDLYKINKQLAIEEGQKDLFTARLEEYAHGFLASHPIAYGTLCLHDERIVGFSVCHYTFATYLGGKALYIEDIYLEKVYRTDENKKAFLQHLSEEAFLNNCVRVEIRVLHACNWGVELIKEFGFEKIEKWSVYRLSKKEGRQEQTSRLH
jgi:hypothetical protein